MRRTANKVILGFLALLALSVPIVGIFVDFGSGTDDAAGEMIWEIAPSYQPAERNFGLSPSEDVEPWLFVLQIVIGLVVFAVALYALKRSRKERG